jgi:hypothetical protein
LLDELDRNVAINKKISPLELEEEKVKTKWVLYENYICNVGAFIDNHPGGKNLLGENLYGDVGRYLTGTQGYSKKITAHGHHFATIRHLILKMLYAKLIQDNTLVTNLNDKSNMIDIFVKVNSKRQIAKDTYEYKFLIDGYSFAKFLPEHHWIGRHFTISNSELDKTRYYSLSLSMNEVYRTKLNNLLDNALAEAITNQDLELRPEEMVANHICFYIKRYPLPNTLSSCLHDHISGFTLKGPFVSYIII